MNSPTHQPVLLNEVIDLLAFEKGDVFVDATLGEGGHSEAVCSRFGEDIRYFGIDADGEAMQRARERVFRSGCRMEARQGNFADLREHLDSMGAEGVSKILFDLGLRSSGLETSGRGFSFRRDEPLIMTFSDTPEADELTAQEVVNQWDEAELKRIIGEFGEERFAGRIASAIVRAREEKIIKTTAELEKVVFGAVPARFRHGRLHPATKTFQAIRMAVNDEIESLNRGLSDALAILEPKGRIAVISFHSGEDRVVKNFFREAIKEGRMIAVTKKPLTANLYEREDNPRARSAKLRVAEKI